MTDSLAPKLDKIFIPTVFHLADLCVCHGVYKRSFLSTGVVSDILGRSSFGDSVPDPISLLRYRFGRESAFGCSRIRGASVPVQIAGIASEIAPAASQIT